jgi:hypothetical protein
LAIDASVDSCEAMFGGRSAMEGSPSSN